MTNPPRKRLPRRVRPWSTAALLRMERVAYWRGFADGSNEAQAALSPTYWTDVEINAYYARTRGF